MPEASSPVNVEYTTDSSTKESFKKGLDTTLASIVVRKQTKKGNTVFALNKEGREKAGELYKELKNEDPASIKQLTREVGEELRGEIKALKRAIKAEAASSWVGEEKGKDRIAAIKKRAEELLTQDSRIQTVQAKRKILASITQRANAEITKAKRGEIKKSLTSQEIAEFRTRLPNLAKTSDAFIINALVAKKFAVEESISSSQAAQAAREQITKEVSATKPQEREAATEKALRLAKAAKKGMDELKTSVMLVSLRRNLGFTVNELKIAFNGSRQKIGLTLASAALAGALFVAPGQAVSVLSSIESTFAPKVVAAAQLSSSEAGQPAILPKVQVLSISEQAQPEVLAQASTNFNGIRQSEGIGEIQTGTSIVKQRGSIAADLTEEKVIKEQEIVQSSILGIRNNDADIMDYVPKIGASWVRIAGGDGELDKDTKLKAALDAAKEQKIKTLYLFNPTHSLPREEIARRLKGILATYEVMLELGNEPDNLDVPFWENRDLRSFARFIKIASEEAWKINPKTKISIGALVDVSNTKELLDYLKKEGVDTSRLALGVHAYNTVGDIEDKVQAIKKVTNMELIFTELGTVGENKSNIPKLIETAKKYGSLVFLHELPDYEGFGYVTPDSRIANKYFGDVKEWVNKNTQEKFEH